MVVVVVVVWGEEWFIFRLERVELILDYGFYFGVFYGCLRCRGYGVVVKMVRFFSFFWFFEIVCEC